MAYIDGLVAAVPTANKEKYLQHAKICADIFQGIRCAEYC